MPGTTCTNPDGFLCSTSTNNGIGTTNPSSVENPDTNPSNDGGDASSTARLTAVPVTPVGPAATASVETGFPNSSVQASTPSATVTSSGGSNRVSKGAVAGIAVGTAVIGAAIAFLIAFILFKRRKQSSEHPYGESTPELISPLKGTHTPYVQVLQSPAPPVVAAAVPPAKQELDLANLSNSSDFLAGLLPPAADEQAIKSKIAGLFNQIQHHVDSYYRDVHATITPTMENDLARFGSESINVVEVLQNSSMPTVAIKHALASYILSIISPEAEDQATLFPTEISGLKKNERAINSSGDQAAYILYKRLAVHLHASNPTSLQSRQSDIREAAEHFALTFFPWANPMYNDSERDEDLVQTVSNALDLSVWLYGQPFLYEFVWENVGRRGTVVAPGLVRVTNSIGEMCERPQVLLEPVVTTG